MVPFVDFGDDMDSPHVSFKYFVNSLRQIGASSVDLWWNRPPFLSKNPADHLKDQKNEIYEWLHQTYGDHQGNYVVREIHPHEWTIYFLNDDNNGKLILFKLQWGDSYNWPEA